MATTRSALNILQEVRKGELVHETSEKIKTAVAAVREHGKPAKVVIELEIKPYKSGSEKLTDPPLVFIGTVSSKLPEADVPASLMFVGEDGNVTLNPPARQPDLGLRVAAAGGSTTDPQ